MKIAGFNTKKIPRVEYFFKTPASRLCVDGRKRGHSMSMYHTAHALERLVSLATESESEALDFTI